MNLRKTYNRGKYLVYAGAAALLTPLLSFAQGESSTAVGPVTQGGSEWSSTYTIGTLTSVNSAADGLRDMLGKVLGSLVPVVGTVMLAGVAVWAMPQILGIIKTAFRSGKGK